MKKATMLLFGQNVMPPLNHLELLQVVLHPERAPRLEVELLLRLELQNWQFSFGREGSYYGQKYLMEYRAKAFIMQRY